MPRFERAPAEADLIVGRMMERYHPQLRDAGVTVDCLFAFATTDENGDTIGCAVKLHGYACKAVVRVLSLKDRTVGRADVEILIDGDNWDTWSEAEKDALIDHELEHVELRTDKDGLLIRDDLDRPKLRLRKHDWQFGWFDSIARRHGHASGEVQQFEQFKESHRQTWLPFMDKPDQTPVVVEAKSEEPGEADGDSQGELIPLTRPKKKKKAAAKHGGRRAAAGR
jgi:hypothetical protein